MLQNLIYVGIGLFCVLIHVLINANSLKQLAIVGNVPFSFKEYLKRDNLSIIISVCIVFLWLMLYQEIMNKYLLKYSDLVGLSFGIIGFFGMYILSKLLNVSKKYINNKIDDQTNELAEIKKKD